MITLKKKQTALNNIRTKLYKLTWYHQMHINIIKSPRLMNFKMFCALMLLDRMGCLFVYNHKGDKRCRLMEFLKALGFLEPVYDRPDRLFHQHQVACQLTSLGRDFVNTYHLNDVFRSLLPESRLSTDGLHESRYHSTFAQGVLGIVAITLLGWMLFPNAIVGSIITLVGLMLAGTMHHYTRTLITNDDTDHGDASFKVTKRTRLLNKQCNIIVDDHQTFREKLAYRKFMKHTPLTELDVLDFVMTHGSGDIPSDLLSKPLSVPQAIDSVLFCYDLSELNDILTTPCIFLSIG